MAAGNAYTTISRCGAEGHSDRGPGTARLPSSAPGTAVLAASGPGVTIEHDTVAMPAATFAVIET